MPATIDTASATLSRDTALFLLIQRHKRTAGRGWYGAAAQDLRALKSSLSDAAEVAQVQTAIDEVVAACKKNHP